MNAKDAIRGSLDGSDRLILTYISDFEDSELLVRPLEGMNHIAWQLGHLILTERMVVDSIKPGSCPALPENFEEGHGRQCFTIDDPAKFLPRAEYERLWKAQREATRKVLDVLTDEELSEPPAMERLRQFVPTNGAAIAFMGSHATMHAGQFIATRRKLNKPVLI